MTFTDRMKYRTQECAADGYLTVFLALVLTILISFLLTLIEGARYSTLQFESECVTEIGLNSIFGEYHRELLRQYNLFSIDCSYLTAYAGNSNTERHLKEYIDRNISNENVFLGDYLYRDFLGMETENVEILKMTLLSDDEGAVFRKSAVNAVKDDIGLALLEDVKEWVQEVEVNGFNDNHLEEQKQEIDREIEEEIRKIREYNEEKKKKEKKNKTKKEENKDEEEEKYEEYKSPTAFLDEMRKKGILSLVLPENATLSGKRINTGELIGSRLRQGNVSMGNLSVGEETKLQEVEERFLFQEYLLKYMGHYGAEQDEKSLAYQLEYLIGGKDDDMGNLLAVANRICLLREASNAGYLFSDREKSGQAEVLATLLSLLTGAPETKDLIKTSIILGWAYAESVYDVKMLLAGGKIPLVKDDETWHFSLENALNLWSEGADCKKGLTYEDYLRTLLMLSDLDQLTLRAMNLVEADVRRTDQNRFFRLDACLTALEAKVTINSRYGYSFEIKRLRQYEKSE